MPVAQFNLLFIILVLFPFPIANADRKLLHQSLFPIDWTAPPPPPPPPLFPSQPTKISHNSRGASRGIAIGVSLAIVAMAVIALSAFFFLKRRERFAARRKASSVLFSLPAGAAVSSDPLYLGTFEPSSSGKLESKELSSSAPQRQHNKSPTETLPTDSKENERLTTQGDGKSSPVDENVPATSEPASRPGRKQWSKPSPLSPPPEAEVSRTSGRRRWVKPTSPEDFPVPLAETKSDERGDNET